MRVHLAWQGHACDKTYPVGVDSAPDDTSDRAADDDVVRVHRLQKLDRVGRGIAGSSSGIRRGRGISHLGCLSDKIFCLVY